MRPLRGELLLEAWERGSGETALERPLTLLAAARIDAASQELAGLSLAELDRQLLRLRRITFGDALRGVVACDSCGAALDFEVSITSMLNVLEQSPPAPAGISMRPVTTRDLAEAAAAPDPRRRLLELCAADEGPGPDEARAIEQFNQANQDSETRFTLCCAACAATECVALDIGRFLWADVRHAAARLLREVHELAGAYGWTERDILEMSATRRACYLEMARA